MALDTTLVLNTGAVMPQVGFGTYGLKGTTVLQPVGWALEAGYRLVDTAWIYENEAEIGAVWPTHCPRDQLFLTSKLWRSHQSSSTPAVLARLRQTLRRLRTDHLDLWLLHWPGPGHHRFRKHQVPQDWTPAMRLATWQAMEEAQRQGLTRAIGVSNFTEAHLQELLQSCRIRPALNQVELHPLLCQSSLRSFCCANGIVLQAYASLGTGNAALLGHEKVTGIADKHHASTAQVLLRWAIQHGLAVIPRSSQRTHICANRQLSGPELSASEMAALDALDAGRRFCWNGVDPATVPLVPDTCAARLPVIPAPRPDLSSEGSTLQTTIPPREKKRKVSTTATRLECSPPQTAVEPLPLRRRFTFAHQQLPHPATTDEHSPSPQAPR
eukprot:GGOE01041330.1.p1 GENE.GGOE01041330.1~~GGOE01041330.1.p1  ORF type:complete len:384 (-),score=101.90 GGOE01041330.1:85-1236(-)